MTTTACGAWDNADCEGTDLCPPRCPRFVDASGAPVLILPYRPETHEGLLAMYDAVETLTMGLPPLERAARETWLERLANEGWNLVATVGDDVVGHVAVTPADAPDPELVIFVHPAYQGRGIGTELLLQTVAYAASNDHDELTLSVATDRDGVISVYESVGFDVADERALDLEMRLALTEAVVEPAQRPPAARER
ncbi:GNAT family N-acetyltransferase [Natrialbaceae archaeon GCM10025810]|uniref:GNAT family N-acetyltransferase n=1 Tax=Halovalidus salilacus TaxID=3075124 RepID=UPI00361CE240